VFHLNYRFCCPKIGVHSKDHPLIPSSERRRNASRNDKTCLLRQPQMYLLPLTFAFQYANLRKKDTRMLQAGAFDCFVGWRLLWQMPRQHGVLCLCMIALFLPEMLSRVSCAYPYCKKYTQTLRQAQQIKPAKQPAKICSLNIEEIEKNTGEDNKNPKKDRPTSVPGISSSLYF
jgi:hypothetical protein